MPLDSETATAERHRFRRTLVRVLAVQAITLLLLRVLQSLYHTG